MGLTLIDKFVHGKVIKDTWINLCTKEIITVQGKGYKVPTDGFNSN
jgi:hypothetical protein